MTQPAKAQEPSMEEILASIRRIISDDEAGKAATPPSPEAKAAAPAEMPDTPAETLNPAEKHDQDGVGATFAAEPPPEQAASDDILELTEAMTAPARPAEPESNFRTIDGQPDLVFAERDEHAAGPGVLKEAREQFSRNFDERSLMSTSTASAVDSAFNTLAHTVLVQNARTLDDLVKEMLRPMLRAWLDDNLPPLVERLVRAEIERVSRGRG
jgi:cell pole-organizing protein PopZ